MRLIKIFSVIIMLTLISGCSAMLKTEHELFRIHDAYYQSWMLRELEKGTDVFVELKKPDADVEFTSLVFRGVEVDVTASSDGNKTVIKGTINTGPSLIENYDYKTSGAGDVIRYIYGGREYDYPLKNVRRENSEFIE